MAVFPHANLAGSSMLVRGLPPEFVLPLPVAEVRSIAHLLDLVDSGDRAPFCRVLTPFAQQFRGSLFHGGRVQQSNNVWAALLLADTTEDYIAQVFSLPPTSTHSCLLPCEGNHFCVYLHWELGHEGWRG